MSGGRYVWTHIRSIHTVLKEMQLDFQWSWNSTWQSYIICCSTCSGLHFNVYSNILQTPQLELSYIMEWSYQVGQPYKNVAKKLVQYFCSTPFVAIFSLCTVHTYTQDNCSNPRWAHARRGFKIVSLQPKHPSYVYA